ncbi:hypothetical protein HDU97_009239 [Phlyctochytrium planicorne]|nr:hypothetical protein HDU97_009239 [Phlyctochytrium planicorne]
MKIPIAIMLAITAFAVHAAADDCPATPYKIEPDGDTQGKATKSYFPKRTFSPYIDVTAWPTFDMVKYAQDTGVKYFTLGFIVSSNNAPSWGGYHDLEDGFYQDQVKQLRNMGGDVIVSFGGAAGQELALTSTSADDLAKKYQAVIDAYKAKWVDFDVEGGALGNSVKAKSAIERRNNALAKIRQTTSYPLVISYTLPVDPSGLDDNCLALLQNSIKTGAQVDIVNIMAMDYGTSAAPNGATGMGGYAISAASRTKEQLDSIGLAAKVGVTPMIGRNDVKDEIFRVADAESLTKWAKGTNYVSYLGMWSANRDNDRYKRDKSTKSFDVSSLIDQDNGEFGKTFLGFQG